jgi:2-phospho-L-lactate guanylyltransferase
MLDVTRTETKAVAFVPIKNFRHAKSRIAGNVTETVRVAIAQWCAQNTVSALSKHLTTYALCDDPETFTRLRDLGISSLFSAQGGLNEAVNFALSWGRKRGFGYQIITHSDLPLVSQETVSQTLEEIDKSCVTLISDRWQKGTNLIGVPSDIGVKTHFGSESFAKHIEGLGGSVDVSVVRSLPFEIDLDTYEDLTYVVSQFPNSSFATYYKDAIERETRLLAPSCLISGSARGLWPK